MKQKHIGIVNLTVISSQIHDFCIKYERKICHESFKKRANNGSKFIKICNSGKKRSKFK